MKQYYHINSLFLIAACFLLNACKKEWLDVKSNKKLVVPASIAELQGLLDYHNIMNGFSSEGRLAAYELAELGADNYYLQQTEWLTVSSISPWKARAYTFAADIFEGQFVPEAWNFPYQRIFYSNVVLDGLAKLQPDASERTAWEQARGSALFIRSYVFHVLSAVYGQPYREASAAQDPGIPLRLNSDLNEKSYRSTVLEVHNRIISDLKEAIPLLPPVSSQKIRPCKASAYALLARVYLIMGDYRQAALYSDSSFRLSNSLINFNSLNALQAYPFQQYNEEVLYHDRFSTTVFNSSRGIVDTLLYSSYHPLDLRRAMYFNTGSGKIRFRGSYDGSAMIFAGISSNEVLITRAECSARLGNKDSAINDLNRLLITRWTKDKFTPLTAASAPEALDIILTERRKELCFRGIRWMDLRRLNAAGANITVIHGLNGNIYTLPPFGANYTYPIPDDIIEITGMPQNSRQ